MKIRTLFVILTFFISGLVFPLDSYSKGGGHGGGGHGGGGRGGGHHGGHHGGQQGSHHGGHKGHGGGGSYYYGYFVPAVIGYGYGAYAYSSGCNSCHPGVTGERCKHLEHNAMIEEYLRDEGYGPYWRLKNITP
jgi:hypothetical protein